MKLNFGPRGILQIDDARIIYRNFSGRGDKYNREGDRNFSIVIPDHEMADALVAEGWNVKVKPARTPDESDFITLPVKVKFNDRGPKVYLQSGSAHNMLNEDCVGMLDNIDIVSVDMDIRPYDWEINGKDGKQTGRAAYLQSMSVTQRVDRFAERHGNIDEELPFT